MHNIKENKVMEEEILSNGWVLNPNREFDSMMYLKGKFYLNLSYKGFIVIAPINKELNSFRYYGKFPTNNLNLIEELVCWE